VETHCAEAWGPGSKCKEKSDLCSERRGETTSTKTEKRLSETQVGKNRFVFNQKEKGNSSLPYL